MDKSQMQKHTKPSKLDQFRLDFEYNRTLSSERRITKRRTHSGE